MITYHIKMGKIVPLNTFSVEDHNTDSPIWRGVLLKYLFGRMPLKNWIQLAGHEQLDETEACSLLRSIALLDSFAQVCEEKSDEA